MGTDGVVAEMSWSRRVRGRMDRLAGDPGPPTIPGAFLARGAYTPGLPRALPGPRAHDVMDVALRCGAQLLARGAAAVDAESAVHAVATTLGLRDVEVEVTYNALSISAVEQGWPVAASRVVRQATADYQRLTEIHRLVTDIDEGIVELPEALARLDRIELAPHAYRPRVILSANGVLAGAVAWSLGAGWLVATAAFVTGLLIVWVSGRLAGPRLPMFFLAALGGTVAVAVAAGLTAMDVPVRPSLVVASSIIVLLPSVALVGAVRDALVGFPLTAVGRTVEGLVVIAGIVTGVIVGLSLSSALSIDMYIIPADETSPMPWVFRLLAAATAAGAAAVLSHAPRQLVWGAVAIGGVGFTAATLLAELVADRALITAGAAVVVGAGAAIVARRAGTLALVMVVPGLIPLLPGLTIYRGTLLLAGAETVPGLVALLQAGVLMGGLAAGALLGEILSDRRRSVMVIGPDPAAGNR